MGKGSQTTQTSNTSTTAPDSTAAGYYNNLLSSAQGVAATPYQSYTGELTAPVNAQQTAGIGGINAAANYAQPYIQQAAGLATAASTPLTQAQIQQYQSPYTQDVINATQAQFNNQNQQQQQQLTGNAIAQGALGGNRVGVAQAQLAGQQQLAQAPVLAGLANQGYQQGVQTALSQQQAQAQGAYSLGALGTAGQNAALTGAGAQVGAGTLQQSTQQAQDQAAYQQFLQQQAYPFQTTQWLAGIDTGVGSQLGGTSTSNGSTTGPAPSPFGQIAGLGLAAAGAFLKDGGAVRGFDMGGGIGGSPYGGSSGWVPSIGITAGHGAPSPQGGPNAPAQQQQMDPFKMASSAADLSKKLQGGFGFGSPMDIDSGGYGGSSGGFDLGTEGGITGGLGGLYASGGHVRGYDDGGSVAGFGDFIPQSGNLFSDQSPLDTAQWPTGPVNAPGPVVKGDQPSPLDTAAYPAGPSGAPGVVSPSILPDATPQAIPDTSKPIAGIEPATGTAPITPSLAGDRATPTQGYAANIANLSHAVKTVESGGNYQAIGPQTRTGDRAYGAYQVMGANIPQWTKEVLGQSLTPQQFLASTEAQDAVARAKLGQYTNKYGPEGAAKAWFAGEGGMNNPNATDALGTSVSSYGQKVMAALGQAPNQQAGLGDTTLPPNAQPVQYQGQKAAQSEQGPLGRLLSGVGINLSPAAKQAILSAGFGMMASRSPFAANAIGEGGLQGMKTYSESKAAEQSGALANRKIELEAQKLGNAADMAQKNLALHTKTAMDTADYHKGILEDRSTKSGYVKNADGTMSVIKGGPADPETISAVAKAKGSATDQPTLSDAAIKRGVEQMLAGDYSIKANLGRGKQGAANLTALENAMADEMDKRNMTGAQRAAVNSNFKAQTAAMKTAAVREANVSASVEEAKNTFPLALKASAAVPRTQFVPWNQLVQKVQAGTSNKELAQLYTATQGAITAYAQAMARTGVMTVDGRHAAEQLLKTATSQEAYEAILGQMAQEMKAAEAAPETVRHALMSRISGEAPPASQLQPSVAAPVTTSGFTGRTATGPNGQKMRETSDGKWVP